MDLEYSIQFSNVLNSVLSVVKFLSMRPRGVTNSLDLRLFLY
jgi:hypothetical protein